MTGAGCRRAGVIGVVALLTWASLAVAAAAGLSSAVTGSTPLTLAVLQPPTKLTAAALCHGSHGSTVTLSWTATTSAFAAGYRVSRSVSGGPLSTVASVSGAATTTWTDTTIVASTTYTYAVVATYLGWTSVAATVTLTTGSHC